MKAKKEKLIRTIEEYEKAMEEAEHNGEPLVYETYTVDMNLSEADAKKCYARAWEQGIPEEGRPPFVQPDSPGQKRKQ
jgi:hypothetical protein